MGTTQRLTITPMFSPVLTVEWTTWLDAENGYVREKLDGASEAIYGPMPRDALGPFLDERREAIEDAVRRRRDQAPPDDR